jgi:hypothetical protein
MYAILHVLFFVEPVLYMFVPGGTMKVFLCCTATIGSAANLEAVFQTVNYATDEPVRYHLPQFPDQSPGDWVTSATGMFPSPPM